MKLTWKLIFLAVFTLSRVALSAQIESSTYDIDVSLDDMTRGDLSGRMHLKLLIKVFEPTVAEIQDITEEGDEGPVNFQRLAIGGNPVIGYQVVVTRDPMQGGAPLLVNEDSSSETQITTLPPANKSGPFNVYFGTHVNAANLSLTDDHGVPFYLSMEFSRSYSLQLSGLGKDPKAAITANNSTAIEFRATAKRSAALSTSYDMVGRYLSGPNETSQPCDHVGGSRLLRSMYGNEKRLEYCYPSTRTNSGFERIILPVSGISPTENMNEGLKRLMDGPSYEEVRVNAGTIQSVLDEGKFTSHIAEHPLLTITDPRNMNCHGFAVRATLAEKISALPPEANWLEGSCPNCTPHWGVEGTYPMLAVLERNYNEVATFNIPPYRDFEPVRKIVRDPRVKPGDLVVLKSEAGLIHSAVLIPGPKPDMLWLEGKFESGPVVDSPIEAVVNVYPPKEITIYRAK